MEMYALSGAAVVAMVGVKVNVLVGGVVAAPMLVGKGVLLAVEEAITGVAEALVTPITTGVPVNMEGVGVNGRKGVGGLYGKGWMTQPLHEDNRNVIRIAGMIFFISSPLRLFYPC